jgi:ABC-type lipoprotein export system ATPase subunit
MQNVHQVTRQDEPIDLSLFYELLQDHAHGSVQCKGADSVMLFGSTGVGKSTMLHLLAGAEFSYESVEIESELGGVVINQHLRTQMEIPGCAIGKSLLSFK